jgi:2'-5' RNA ligase
MTWLVPSAGPARDKLADTIARLAAEHGTPAFPPHITMARRFDADADDTADGLASLVAGVPPFTVTLSAVAHEDAYFRSLYLTAEPSAPLSALSQAAAAAWGIEPLAHRPHLSLMYSDFTAERKLPIIATIGISLPLSIEVGAAELWAAGGQGVAGWRRCRAFPLGHRR